MTDSNIAYTSDGFCYSINKLSEALGVSRETVRKRTAMVKPAKERNGFPVYHLRDVVKLIDNAMTNTEDPDELPPRARKDWYEGEQKKVAIAQKKGQLLDAEETRLKIASFLKIIMTMFDMTGDRVEREVGLNPEQLKAIESIIDQCRELTYNELCSQTQIESLAS